MSPSREKWVECWGRWAGLYSVSDMGRVRSNFRRVGGGFSRQQKILRLKRRPDGYRSVSLSDSGYSETWLVHRLVLFSFVGPPGEGLEASHLDACRSNNRLDNLIWETHPENLARVSSNSGPGLYGEAHGMAKLTEAEAREIRTRHQDNRRGYAATAREFGISDSTVSHIVNGRLWAHLAINATNK